MLYLYNTTSSKLHQVYSPRCLLRAWQRERVNKRHVAQHISRCGSTHLMSLVETRGRLLAVTVRAYGVNVTRKAQRKTADTQRHQHTDNVSCSIDAFKFPFLAAYNM